MTKLCTTCGVWKDADTEYYQGGGHRSCKECIRQAQRIRNRNNPSSKIPEGECKTCELPAETGAKLCHFCAEEEAIERLREAQQKRLKQRLSLLAHKLRLLDLMELVDFEEELSEPTSGLIDELPDFDSLRVSDNERSIVKIWSPSAQRYVSFE